MLVRFIWPYLDGMRQNEAAARHGKDRSSLRFHCRFIPLRPGMVSGRSDRLGSLGSHTFLSIEIAIYSVDPIHGCGGCH
jgi:hypothetical protein